jgi:hypothetical protein
MPSRPPKRLAASGPLWFLVSVLGSLGGVWLARRTLVRYTDPPPGGLWLLLAGQALIVLAGFAAW